jgi:hypothetical protein
MSAPANEEKQAKKVQYKNSAVATDVLQKVLYRRVHLIICARRYTLMLSTGYPSIKKRFDLHV